MSQPPTVEKKSSKEFALFSSFVLYSFSIIFFAHTYRILDIVLTSDFFIF